MDGSTRIISAAVALGPRHQYFVVDVWTGSSRRSLEFVAQCPVTGNPLRTRVSMEEARMNVNKPDCGLEEVANTMISRLNLVQGESGSVEIGFVEKTSAELRLEGKEESTKSLKAVNTVSDSKVIAQNSDESYAEDDFEDDTECE